MKLLLCVPTLSRADLLNENYEGLANCLEDEDRLLVLDNGMQAIGLEPSDKLGILRSAENLGVSKSWNLFLKIAFVLNRYDGCVLLQDDIKWSRIQVDSAKALMLENLDVDLFLSFHQFSVQVHRPSNIRTIGYYDKRFSPAWCEDDDYAVTMITKGRIYRRFAELDPLPGSIENGTTKPGPWETNNAKLKDKWGEVLTVIDPDFGVNYGDRDYYETNAGRVERRT